LLSICLSDTYGIQKESWQKFSFLLSICLSDTYDIHKETAGQYGGSPVNKITNTELVQRRSSVGAVLEQCWSSVGAVLEQRRSCDGENQSKLTVNNTIQMGYFSTIQS
jgi:hypothetical protein